MSRPAKKNPVTVELGRRIRQRRTEVGLTQERLAHDAGFHPTWISEVETGDRNPSFSNLAKLAAGLDIDLGTLLKDFSPSSEEDLGRRI